MLSRLARRSIIGLSSRQGPLTARCIQRQAALGSNSAAPLTTTPTRWTSSKRTTGATGPITVQSVSILEDLSGIKIERPKSEKVTENRVLPNLWLRDNCQCSACVNQDTRQRNFDTFELHDIKPEHLLNHETHLEVKWNDNHTSIHPWEWLRCWFRGGFQREFAVDEPQKLWDSSIENDPPKVDYSLGVEQIMADLTKKIWVHGFCLVENAEPTPEATEAFLEKIGPIRNTHYGGFYDFVPDLALADTAYTNIALPAHTDTTYFSEPAGLQAFHCLSHAAPPDQDPEKPLGGESLLVDGFNVAKILRKESPEAYDVLRRTRIPWHASGNKGIAIAPDRTYPVIEADWETNKFHRIRWNNDDRGVVHLFDAKPWYEAASKWNEIVRRETSEFWFKLTPGTIVIFNNWRVMHGRSAFKGTRRICGAYIPRDDFVSRYRETNFEHDKVIGHNLNQSGSHRPRQDRVGYRRPGYYSDRKSDRKSDSKSDSETDPKSDAKNDPKTDPESDPKSDPKLESKPETGSDS